MICVRASVMLADGAGDAPLNGVSMVVLVLGWLLSNRFCNNGLLLVASVCCVSCMAVAAPISGGGDAVG